MQLWFAHESGVTLREQLVTQIILGILSDDLPPGQRLPSTRDLARRFHLHPNTVSAGYRQLERERWVEFRRGSGVYVRDAKPESALSPAFALDQLVGELLRSARRLSIPLSTVRSRLRHWFELQAPDHFVLIEPDEELRRILAMEMRRGVTLPVKSCGLESSQFSEALEKAIPVTLAGKEKIVRHELPEGTELLVLQVRSVPTSLAGWLPAPAGIFLAWPRDGRVF
jgi:DNA-binding transcriptional regulator YhcF (GntR family)